MQALKEIIHLLSQNQIHPFEHLKSADGKSAPSKLLALYEGVANGQFHSDIEAEKAIYGDQAGRSAYRKLKSDLRDHLFEAVMNININQGDFSDYQAAYYQCHRQWLMVRILTGMNANTAALSLAARLLKQADRFDFTLLCMDIVSFLRLQYGLRESNDQKFNKAQEDFIQYRALYDAECLAEELYTNLIVRYVNHRSAPTEVHESAVNYYEKIKGYMQQHQSYKLQMYGYLIGLLSHISVNDYQRAEAFCNEAITFFGNRPYEARTPLQIFHYQNLICNIQLRQFEAGRTSAHECLKYLEEGTYNWFKYHELYLQLSFHSKEYQRADDTLKLILQHNQFHTLPEQEQSLWSVYGAYMYYLHLMGKIHSNTPDKYKDALFDDQSPVYSKDKGILSITTIIARLLILLKEHKYRQVIGELDDTNQYCYRHLRGEHTKRSYYLIKMLLSIPLGLFDEKQVQSKAASLFEKLQQTPFQVANQTHEFEMIPYEDLWEMALESLR
jgi:hypothetical protein